MADPASLGLAAVSRDQESFRVVAAEILHLGTCELSGRYAVRASLENGHG
jgi:hypothetical protein